MSRGLGRVERFVLSWLAVEERHNAELWTLSHAAAGHVDCPRCAACGFKAGDVPAATYNAVARAVSSLERKGLVRSEHHIERPAWDHHTRSKTIHLSVET